MRGHEGLAACGLFRLCLHDVDQRHRAHFDARLVVLHQLAGEIERLLGHFDGFYGEHVVPVGIPDIRQRVGNRRAQLNVRDVAIELGDLKLLPVRVDPEISKQWLDEHARPDRIELWIEQRVVAVGQPAAVVQRELVRSAAPREGLREASVIGQRFGIRSTAASRELQLTGRCAAC